MRVLKSSLVLLLLAFSLAAQQLSIKPDKATGIYAAGDAVRWSIESESPNATNQWYYAIKSGGTKVVREGSLALSGGKAELAATAADPGWLLLEVSASKSAGTRFRGGVMVSPEKVEASAERPSDFDAFWAAKLEELAKVPLNPRLTRGDSGKTNVEYFTIEMDNIRGSRIRGQLARPAGGQKLAALLIVQWAGVYPLQKSWVVDRAAEGWLALNIIAHDLPIAEPEGFYKEQNEGALKGYPHIGNDDRDTSYFLRMYLSCYRAADYLVARPDWNGETLAVTGTSQGGLQALMTAGFHPKITAALANVPAGCDHTGVEAERMPGWPMWTWNAQGKDAAKVREASRYYDVVNFASRIRCPVLIGIGGIDTTCAPIGIYAARNQIKSPVEVVFMPLADHRGKHDAYYARFSPWLNAARDGKMLPPP